MNHTASSALYSTSFTVALAGNPNSGKTSLFNLLTGSRYKVANYPGVTVERKIATANIPGLADTITFIDIPGIYSLSSTSIDEEIAEQTLIGKKFPPYPDLIVCVLDAANLERNLFLLTQLIDTGIPVIAALNMVDVAKNRGIKIYEQLLSKELSVPVVTINAKQNKGTQELTHAIALHFQAPSNTSKPFGWCKNVEVLNKAREIGATLLPDENSNLQTLKGFSALSHSLSENEISSYESAARYAFAGEICKKCFHKDLSSSNAFIHRVDHLTTHPLWGSVLFVFLMAMIFQSIFTWAQTPMEWIDAGIGAISGVVAPLLPDGVLKSLILDGIIAGVGSVLIFIPQIALLLFFLGLLEDSGYLSRAAFLLDGVMRKVGLQGRSFIPLLSSFACAIPGIMATRTIPSWPDRLATILVAPLMSCSARLPVYTVLIAAVIPQTKIWGIFSLQGLTMFSLYILGIAGAAIVAWALKKTALKSGTSFFIMEFPPLRLPSVKLILREVCDRIILFCKTAGTVILACTIVLWFLSSYPRDAVDNAPSLKDSYAGRLGTMIEPAIKPIGLNWEMGIGIVASFAAREVFVSALATIYNVEESQNEDSADEYSSIITVLRQKASVGELTLASALSLMVFYVFACQCMSTLAVARRETGSWYWTGFMFVYMTALAYIMSFIVYRLFL